MKMNIKIIFSLITFLASEEDTFDIVEPCLSHKINKQSSKEGWAI